MATAEAGSTAAALKTMMRDTGSRQRPTWYWGRRRAAVAMGETDPADNDEGGGPRSDVRSESENGVVVQAHLER